MNEQHRLSEVEWTLVVELLERELHELPAEIHHTRVTSFREELKHRAEVARNLLGRLKAPSA